MQRPKIMAAIKAVAILMDKQLEDVDHGTLTVEFTVHDGEITMVDVARKLRRKTDLTSSETWDII